MKETRIAKWDNLKFIMIFCVVTGHFLGEMVSGNVLGQSFYMFLYTFHMPVFFFIAGMFSKKIVRERRFEAVIQYGVIYLFMKVLDKIAAGMKQLPGRSLFLVMKDAGKNFHFFWEDGPGWFAFAMAVFLLLTMLLQKCNARYMLAIAVFVGCVAGLDTHLGPVSGMGNHFCLMRICVFYPVFLLGYYIDPQVLDRERKWYQILCAFSILMLCLFLCILLNQEFTLFGRTWNDGFLYGLRDFLKGKSTYYKIGKVTSGNEIVTIGVGLWGIFLRFACYVVWGILIMQILILCPKKKYFWSWLGKRTMSVFIWHKICMVFLLYVLHGKEFLLTKMPHTYLPTTVCLALILTIVTSYLPEFRVPNRKK